VPGLKLARARLSPVIHALSQGPPASPNPPPGPRPAQVPIMQYYSIHCNTASLAERAAGWMAWPGLLHAQSASAVTGPAGPGA
jgi:hypothetical protein